MSRRRRRSDRSPHATDQTVVPGAESETQVAPEVQDVVAPEPVPVPPVQQSQQVAPSGDGRQERAQGRGKRGPGSKGKSLYAFSDGIERCFCRSATHATPKGFPAIRREGVAVPGYVVLASNERVVLLCDLLHDGPHLWPDGEPVVVEQ